VIQKEKSHQISDSVVQLEIPQLDKI